MKVLHWKTNKPKQPTKLKQADKQNFQVKGENPIFPARPHSPVEETQLTNISGTEFLQIVFTNILSVCLSRWSLKILPTLTLSSSSFELLGSNYHPASA